MNRMNMSDEAWEKLAPFFEKKPGTRGRPRPNARKMVEGVCWILRTGAPWRDLPETFGKWDTVYKAFARWRDNGAFERAQTALLLELQEELPPEHTVLWFVDSTIARAAKSAAGAKKKVQFVRADEPGDHALGRSRGGFGTKVHLVCDANAVPLQIYLTGGQAHDGATLPLLLDADEGMPLRHLLECDKVVADKGYDSAKVRAFLREEGIEPHIPTRKNARKKITVDAELYRQRNKVERVFGWMKELRRLATRFEKLAVSFKAFWQLAMGMRYIQRLTAA